MWKLLEVIGKLLVVSELISFISIWPSLYNLMPLLPITDEPYMQIVPGDSWDYYRFIPLLIGVIFLVVGAIKSKEV